MANIAKKSYEDSIAKFHTVTMKEAVKQALLTVPTRADFMKEAFGTTDKKEFTDMIAALLQPLATLVARLWKYYQEKKIANLE